MEKLVKFMMQFSSEAIKKIEDIQLLSWQSVCPIALQYKIENQNNQSFFMRFHRRHLEIALPQLEEVQKKPGGFF